MMSAVVRDRGPHRRMGTKSARARRSAPGTRILLAVAPRLLRDSLRRLIADEPDLEVVGDPVDPVDVLIATGQTQADIVLLSGLRREICRGPARTGRRVSGPDGHRHSG